jgi:hypothetical protein
MSLELQVKWEKEYKAAEAAYEAEISSLRRVSFPSLQSRPLHSLLTSFPLSILFRST